MPEPDKRGNVQGRDDFLKRLLRSGQSPPPHSNTHASSSGPPENTPTRPTVSSITHGARPEHCPHCDVVIEQHRIAIACQVCNRLVVEIQFWHGALIVIIILLAAAINAAYGQLSVSAAVGLIASQILLFFAFRPLQRSLGLFLTSSLLLPASFVLSFLMLDVHDFLPAYLAAVPAWTALLICAALLVELFVYWKEAGKRHQLSIWRILGTFSIATSMLAVALLFALSVLPKTFSPAEGPVWNFVMHALRFRSGSLLLWVAYVALLALPPTFRRRVDVGLHAGLGPIAALFLYVSKLSAGVVANFGACLREGMRDVLLLLNEAIIPVAQRFLFLGSVQAWQVSFSILAACYLDYLGRRGLHSAQLLFSAPVAAVAPLAIFWAATRSRLSEIVVVAARTCVLTGLLLAFCSAVAATLWWSYERTFGGRHDVNWLGVVSIALISLSPLVEYARRQLRRAP